VPLLTSLADEKKKAKTWISTTENYYPTHFCLLLHRFACFRNLCSV